MIRASVCNYTVIIRKIPLFDLKSPIMEPITRISVGDTSGPANQLFYMEEQGNHCKDAYPAPAYLDMLILLEKQLKNLTHSESS